MRVRGRTFLSTRSLQPVARADEGKRTMSEMRDGAFLPFITAFAEVYLPSIGYPFSTSAPPTAATLRFRHPCPPDTIAEPVVEPNPFGEAEFTETDELPPPPAQYTIRFCMQRQQTIQWRTKPTIVKA